MSRPQGTRRVAVGGGGVAGLAAACALAQDGYAVELFEKRPYVGGRLIDAKQYLVPDLPGGGSCVCYLRVLAVCGPPLLCKRGHASSKQWRP